MNNSQIITIFGSGKSGPGEATFQIAAETGRVLAEKGFTIANGGYGGTMLAAAEAAARAGGRVIGVTCSAFKSTANEYVTEEIVTDTLQQRLNKLVELANAYIVLPGGTGTLLELAQVWELKNKRFPGTDKPIIIIGGSWKPLTNLMAGADAECIDCIRTVDSPDQAVEILTEYFN